jgi:hypothetical protein
MYAGEGVVKRFTPHSVGNSLCFELRQEAADGTHQLLELVGIDDWAGVAARPGGLKLGQAVQGSGHIHFVKHLYALPHTVQNLRQASQCWSPERNGRWGLWKGGWMGELFNHQASLLLGNFIAAPSRRLTEKHGFYRLLPLQHYRTILLLKWKMGALFSLFKF